MASPTPIEPNLSDANSARLNRTTNQAGKFDSVYDTLSYTAQLAGPAAYETAALYRPESADVVGAAVNATAGYGYGPSMSPGVFSGGAGNYMARPMGNLTVGGSVGGSVGGNSAGDTIGQAQQMLADSQASSVAMLMIQDEMGQQNRLYTSTSNLMNSRDSMVASIIRNVRVG